MNNKRPVTAVFIVLKTTLGGGHHKNFQGPNPTRYFTVEQMTLKGG